VTKPPSLVLEKKSKRQPVRLRHKIEKRVNSKARKEKKGTKKHPELHRGKKQEKLNIPNSYPYKDRLLAEIEESKRIKEEERLARLEENRRKKKGEVAQDGELPEVDEALDMSDDEDMEDDDAMEDDDEVEPVSYCPNKSETAVY